MPAHVVVTPTRDMATSIRRSDSKVRTLDRVTSAAVTGSPCIVPVYPEGMLPSNILTSILGTYASISRLMTCQYIERF